MEFASFMKFLSQSDGFGCGFFVFGCFSPLFFLCALLVLGLKFLHSNGPSLLVKMYRHSLKIESCSDSFNREDKDCNNNNGFVSKSHLVDQKKPIILHWTSDSSSGRLSCDLLLRDGLDLGKNRDGPVQLLETEHDESEEEESGFQNDEDKVFDVITLRKMVKQERKRGDCVKMELEKERRASESAAEEAMAMLLKLRMDKSSVEMEAKQYRRVAEQKQFYDQEVIQSLQWMLMKLDDQDKTEIQTNSST